MKKLIEQYELVKEIEYFFDGIDFKIIGRIYKVIIGPNAKYMWKVNYYCRLEEEIETYTPSAPFGDTVEMTETKLLNYINRFECAIEWRPNKYF